MMDDLLTKTKNNIFISKNDINILSKYGIYVNEFKTINELIFNIEDIINNEDLSNEELDELDYISEILQERNYYQNTNK